MNEEEMRREMVIMHLYAFQMNDMIAPKDVILNKD
jgi:hypothetical protein